MYERWVSFFEFRWTPILTYRRRHLELLDWFEENLEPVAFNDDPDRLGIAMGAHDLRIVVQRNGMTVDSGLSGKPTSELLPAIAGVLEVLKPRETVLTMSNVISTVELDGRDYETARGIFARGVAGAPQQLCGMTPLDASVLMDFKSSSVAAQVEWGIVESSELLQRLGDPRISRVEKHGGELRRRVAMSPASTAPGRIPDVSVFAEVAFLPQQDDEVTDAASVGNVMVEYEASAEQLALGLMNRFEAAEVSAKEGSTW